MKKILFTLLTSLVFILGCSDYDPFEIETRPEFQQYLTVNNIKQENIWRFESITREREQNPLKLEERLLGKDIVVSGLILSINNDSTYASGLDLSTFTKVKNQPSISFFGVYEGSTMEWENVCITSKEQKGDVAKLIPQQRIIVRGVLSGIDDLGVVLYPCRIVLADVYVTE